MKCALYQNKKERSSCRQTLVCFAFFLFLVCVPQHGRSTDRPGVEFYTTSFKTSRSARAVDVCRRTCVSCHRAVPRPAQAKLQEEPSDTPLQEKLDAMAAMIGYVGMACAAATFVATMCVYFTTHRVSPADLATRARGCGRPCMLMLGGPVAYSCIVAGAVLIRLACKMFSILREVGPGAGRRELCHNLV